MKNYNKPELNVEAFDVEDIIAQSISNDVENDLGDLSDNMVAGIEFSITANGNDEF